MNTLSNMKRQAALLTAELLIAAGITIAPAAAQAQAHAPGIVGIDHIGINVPDLDQAVAFFHDMFGFEPVTRIGPVPINASWKQAYHLHDAASEVTLVMLRAGDGANIELFGYKPGAGSTQQPYRDDIAATHIALYTTDIDGAKAYLESKGIKFLTDINSGGGDTAGERWVYFETPWGASIELNSYPNGKGYEQHHPAVKLWTAASTVELATTGPGAAELQALANRQADVWNEPDPRARLAKLQALYHANIAFFDHEGAVNGVDALNARITKLQHTHPGFRFTTARIDNSNNVVRYEWRYGPAAKPGMITGMDLIVLENGRIRSLNTFVDPAARDKRDSN
jgi:catechol 2,3-dioxygenase-like lactoylglutathione lyase family enzyme